MAAEANDSELSCYCKAYLLADLRRFRKFSDELLADRSANDLKADGIVFVHPNCCVTQSLFVPRRIERNRAQNGLSSVSATCNSTSPMKLPKRYPTAAEPRPARCRRAAASSGERPGYAAVGVRAR